MFLVSNNIVEKIIGSVLLDGESDEKALSVFEFQRFEGDGDGDFHTDDRYCAAVRNEG